MFLMQITPIIVLDCLLSRASEAMQQVVGFEFADLVEHNDDRVHVVFSQQFQADIATAVRISQVSFFGSGSKATTVSGPSFDSRLRARLSS